MLRDYPGKTIYLSHEKQTQEARAGEGQREQISIGQHLSSPTDWVDALV